MREHRYISIFTILLLIGCSCAQKFDIKDLPNLGKTAIISNSTYQVFYIPGPLDEEKEYKEIEDLVAFLEGFPLAKILRQKVYNALINRLDLVPDSTIEKIEDTYLPNFFIWAKKNHVKTIIHLESTIEVSNAYRTYSVSLKNYPKIWTKIRIIRASDGEVLWTKRIWTHAFDGTALSVKSYSVYDTVFNKKDLEILINKKIDYIVQKLLNSLS